MASLGTVVSFRRTSHKLPIRQMSPQKTPRILMLQGPVGPFFKKLQDYLNDNDIDAWRVTFNAGDRSFAGRRKTVNFGGRPSTYTTWLEQLLKGGEFSGVVLFGCARPVHDVARRICRRLDIPVLSLEEGYMRPGFVTMEFGGNNALSPLAGRLPPAEIPADSFEPRPEPARSSFSKMGIAATRYYITHGLFSTPTERRLFHKRDRARLQAEACLWIRNMIRKYKDLPRNATCMETLLERHDKNYYFVPLQVSDDSQLHPRWGRGWNNRTVITRLTESFAAHAPKGSRLVFKIHPIDRGHGDYAQYIASMAALYGVGDRIDILTSGSVGLMARHARAMITINSSSGFSALHHGTPLGVLGRCIYNHPDLVTNLIEPGDVDAFWNEQKTPDISLSQNFIRWIRAETLVYGDFYLAEEFERTAEGILSRCRAMIARKADAKIVPLSRPAEPVAPVHQARPAESERQAAARA